MQLTDVIVIAGELTIILLCIWAFKKAHKNKVKEEIAKEKKLVKHYQKEIANASGDVKSVKSVTTIRIGKSDMADCPYCGRRFSVKDGTCPSCGATAQVTDDEVVVTKTEEHQEVLKALEYQHRERLEKLKNERSAKRNENITMMVFSIFFIAAFVFVIMAIIKKAT